MGGLSGVERAAASGGQSPLGIVPVRALGGGADDWPRIFGDPGGIGTNAAAAGDELRFLSSTFTVASGLLSIPDRFALKMGPHVSIVSTLTQAGGFPGHYVFHLDAPGAVDLGALKVTPAIGSTLITVSLSGAPLVDSFVQLTHGVSCEMFKILQVAANGLNWDLTIDQPTALPWTSAAGGDIAQIYSTRPSQVDIDFNGEITGTGDQIVQIVRTERSRFRGFTYNGSGGLAQGIFGWDLGCRDGSLEDAVVDCTGSDPTHGATGIFIQSSEQMYVRRSRVIGASNTGFNLLDAVDSGFEDVRADKCTPGSGFAMSSLGVVDGKQSFGCFYTFIRNALAISCAVGFNVAQVGLAYGSVLDNVTALACTSFGVLVNAGSTNLSVRTANLLGCATGLLIEPGATGTEILDLCCDGSTALALGVLGDVDVRNMRATVNYANGNGVITISGVGPWTFRGLRLTQQNAGGYLVYGVAAGQLVIDDAELLGNPAVGLWLNSAGLVATVSNTKIVAGQGIVVPNGAKVILGDNVDLSGCASPFTDGGGPPLGMVTGHFAGDSLIPMAAADHTATWADYAVESVQIGGTLLLAPRALIFPPLHMTWNVLNGADQIVTVKAASGTGVAIAVGASAVVTYDGTNFIQVG